MFSSWPETAGRAPTWPTGTWVFWVEIVAVTLAGVRPKLARNGCGDRGVAEIERGIFQGRLGDKNLRVALPHGRDGVVVLLFADCIDLHQLLVPPRLGARLFEVGVKGAGSTRNVVLIELDIVP